MVLMKFLAAAAALAVIGCAGSPGEDLPPFGETVMAVKEAQTWKEGDHVPALHGDRSARNMEVYRQGDKGQNSQAKPVSISEQ